LEEDLNLFSFLLIVCQLNADVNRLLQIFDVLLTNDQQLLLNGIGIASLWSLVHMHASTALWCVREHDIQPQFCLILWFLDQRRYWISDYSLSPLTEVVFLYSSQSWFHFGTLRLEFNSRHDNLIERTPPPWGGLLSTMFPDQEPSVRDFTT